ncbi:MAG: DUF3429 domain-containing protein [Pseudomonadota bacterium]
MAFQIPRQQPETPSPNALEKTSRTAWLLALAGFIPFAGLMVGLLVLGTDHPWYGLVQQGLATYGAVILSFLGGIRWGLALHTRNEDVAPLVLIFSVVPSLVGWFSLLAPAPYVFGILAIGFAGQGAWDAMTGPDQGFPQWFSRLRQWLTLIVTLALVVAFFATIDQSPLT